MKLRSSSIVYLLLIASWAVTIPAKETKKSVDESAELLKSKKLIQELREQLSKSQEDVQRLERNKEAVIADYKEQEQELEKLHRQLAECVVREKDLTESESYLKQELGKFAIEVSRIRSESRNAEKELLDCRQAMKKRQQQQQDSAGKQNCECPMKEDKTDKAETSSSLDELSDKLSNCEETVKAIRDRCDKDQAALKKLSKEHEHLSKTSGNCTNQLKECDTQKGYLEFLKKGYDVVVQDLEKEAKEAKENKEQCDKEADDAIRGASRYRTYLVAIGILGIIVFTVKFYQIANETIRRRTAAAREAKAREKLETKKKKK